MADFRTFKSAKRLPAQREGYRGRGMMLNAPLDVYQLA